MDNFKVTLRKNLVLYLTLGVLVSLLIAAAQGMESKDFVITFLRGLAVGSLTFLVASGFSLIFGLMHVLNLAHGTLYMIGAYIAWTVFVRPDTFVDLLTPLALLLSGFTLQGVWAFVAARIRLSGAMGRILPWGGMALSLVILFMTLARYPIAVWDVEVFAQSPGTYAFMADQGTRLVPEAAVFEGLSPALAVIGLLAGSLLAAFSMVWLAHPPTAPQQLTWRHFAPFAVLSLVGILALIFNEPLTAWLVGLNTNWLFLVSVVVAVLAGMGLGGLMEVTLIRPLYVRHIYQIMLTLGMSVIGVEIVRAVWGRPEFIMPKPALFTGSGPGCPATTLAAWWQLNCATILVLGGRVRVYNEIFIPLVGLVVLVAVWLLLKRSRLGMIIRAGVQDSEMVEALGINVRQVFTLVFALGVGLAALGGALAAPSLGLSYHMGESVMLNALVALAIGGLTSYPGAALGSVIVGLIQQFMIKYGQIGIAIPFTEIVFKPTPPIVPASTIFLMVIILLLLPNGLLGKKE
ncbi:MAG: branched-chain amino acid ABC transporter permease [Anaerolineae bacterium]|nr:MAG: branched-chain amino acid ABC transporter permease [Anaerolineae bacterium]